MDARPTILDLFGDSFTEPLTVTDLADIFGGISREKMRKIMERWSPEDVDKDGQKLRIRIRRMPYSYLIGSLSPDDLKAVGKIWQKVENGHSKAA